MLSGVYVVPLTSSSSDCELSSSTSILNRAPTLTVWNLAVLGLLSLSDFSRAGACEDGEIDRALEKPSCSSLTERKLLTKERSWPLLLLA